MPKDTKTLGNNKARACESLGFVHKKRLCQRFDTTSSLRILVIINKYYQIDTRLSLATNIGSCSVILNASYQFWI